MNLKYMSVYEGLEHIEDLKALSSYRPGTRKGYIYVVEFRKDGGGLCKIGQTGCPYHLVFGRILRLVQIVVERAARKSGKLQQCFQRVFLP